MAYIPHVQLYLSTLITFTSVKRMWDHLVCLLRYEKIIAVILIHKCPTIKPNQIPKPQLLTSVTLTKYSTKQITVLIY